LRSTSSGPIDRRAVHGVAARRISAVRPVQDAPIEIQLQIDGLRQAVEQQLDVAAMGRFLALRDLDTGAEDATPLGVVRAFLRPVDLSACGIDGDADAPARLVAPIDIAMARLHEGVNL